MKVSITKKPELWDKVKKRPDPLSSVALTIPVFLVYHLGILVVQSRSGVDLISNVVFGLLNASTPVYVMATLALAMVLALAVWIEERRGAATSVPLARVLLEGGAFTLVVLAGFGWAASHALRSTDPQGVAALGVLDKIVLACGTGFHEELIFRAVLVTGLAALLSLVFRMSKNAGLGTAVLISSLAFSLVHNIGAFGEPFEIDIALYRMVLGALFAGLYLVRGFATVVYAHVFFELLVYFLYG